MKPDTIPSTTPSAIPSVEDILVTLTELGYVVANTFQIAANDARTFGQPGWQVYLRNERNTRTGLGVAPTLAGAFRAAVLNAEAKPLEVPTKQWGERPGEVFPILRVPSRVPPGGTPRVILGDPSDSDNDEADLF